MATATPDIQWVKIQGTFHVQVIPGATSTRCNKKIPVKAERSSVAMPTHCKKCRLHWRDAVKTALEDALQASPPEGYPAGGSLIHAPLVIDAGVIIGKLIERPELIAQVMPKVARALGAPEPIWWQTGPLPQAPDEGGHASIAIRYDTGSIDEASPASAMLHHLRGSGRWRLEGDEDALDDPADVGIVGWAWLRGKPEGGK